jgi:hypothetical protein
VFIAAVNIGATSCCVCKYFRRLIFYNDRNLISAGRHGTTNVCADYWKFKTSASEESRERNENRNEE